MFRQVWIGTALAVAICMGIGITLEIVSSLSSSASPEGLERRRRVRGWRWSPTWCCGCAGTPDLQGELESLRPVRAVDRIVACAGADGIPRGPREGFETAVFLLATFHASGQRGDHRGSGAPLGILVAVVIGYGIYEGGVRLNLGRFFRITGIVLVFVAAGLAMTAVDTANEAGWLTFGQAQAADLSWLVRPGTPLASIVSGVLGIQPYPAGSKSSAGSPISYRCSLVVAYRPAQSAHLRALCLELVVPTPPASAPGAPHDLD